MSDTVFLEGQTVDLRPLEEDDLEFCRDELNDPRVRSSLGMCTPINMQQEENWFENQLCDDDSSGLHLAISLDGEPVGVINAHYVDETNGNTTLGCWLGADFHGQGYGSDATRALLSYLFEERRLEAVRAEAFAFNEKSRGLLESVGMEQVARIPNWVFVDGEHHDTCVYVVTADQWFGRE
ncbi:GNAT family N-acetyltransferase [Haloarchaeobius sp. TZWWS8]|uniref:GNAT family N-acetyltransferase n=1 Tax=Haloarchaeobius sp. TZWWS8 TaxID=3446121 RepID=UPI003EBC5431